MWAELLLAVFHLSVPSQQEIDKAVEAAAESAGLS